MQLIIDTVNTLVSVKNKVFYLESDKVNRQISPYRISSIAITSNIQINISALKLAAAHKIPIYILNRFGKLNAQVLSGEAYNDASLRHKQYLFLQQKEATEYIVAVLRKKTELQIRNLKNLLRKKPISHAELSDRIVTIEKLFEKTETFVCEKITECRGQLMGLEGNISRQYFLGLKMTLPKEFQFSKRSRRPALDFFNAALNYLYGCTYTIVDQGIRASGLDPYTGMLHSLQPKRPVLSYDLIEPFRPLIDRLLLQLINNQTLTENEFRKTDSYCAMAKSGKRILITAFNDYLNKKVKMEQQILPVKAHIFKMAQDLKSQILKTCS